MKVRVIVFYVEFFDVVYFFKEVKKNYLKDYLFVVFDSWVGFLEII